MRVVEAIAAADIDEAARIWAEATAARDGDSEVPALDEARPVIEAVLSRSERSRLLLALSDEGRAVGFAALAPDEADGSVAEIRYLGVRPDAWGQGVGTALVAALPDRLALVGFTGARLWVYRDNPRAIALYERSGWRAIGRPAPHPGTSRQEQRYELTF